MDNKESGYVQMETTKVLVSVCVPAYNGLKFLDRFIHSFLAQMLQETELIVVDNLSDDGTYERMQVYASAFPERIRIYRLEEHAPGPAAGRNEAIRHAQGEYIYICDCDDVILPHALQKLWEAAQENRADVVVGNAYIVYGNKAGYGRPKTYGKIVEAGLLEEEHVFDAGVEFWRRLIHKSLLERMGPITEGVIYDDIAYTPPLMSYAQKVWAIKEYLYYYFRRADSTGGGVKEEICVGTVISEKWAMDHCNPKNSAGVERYVAERIKGNLHGRWQMQDIFIEELREFWPRFENNQLITEDTKMAEVFEYYLGFPTGKVPSNVFLNGFDRSYSPEELEEWQATALAGGCQIMVLNSETCDLTEKPWMQELFREGKTRFLAQYFGLKRICRDGGIFIDNCLKLNTCFNMLLYHSGFVGLLTNRALSSYVFGGQAGNPFFERVLQTYQSDALLKNTVSIGERFRQLLWAEYQSHDHFARDFYHAFPVVVLMPSYFSVLVPSVRNISEIDVSLLDPMQDDIEQVRIDCATAMKLAVEKMTVQRYRTGQSRIDRVWNRVKYTFPMRVLRKILWTTKALADKILASFKAKKEVEE